MLEGDEIFDFAQETGYRLCKTSTTPAAPDDATASSNEGGIFSTSWDLNFPNRLFVCMQNGDLRSYDMDTFTYTLYQLKFRAQAPAYDPNASREKLIRSHWDKMITIPDRPNEIFFLLGISKSIMFSAFATEMNQSLSSESTLLAGTRADKEGYFYGTAVMEINVHQCRVTALAASPAGHCLASADERGNIRFILLRLLDEMSLFRRNEAKKKKFTSSNATGPIALFQNSYNVRCAAHEGPIFAINWLPLLHEDENTREYVLLSGSLDRSVRLWRVHCNTSFGIQVSAMMVLDTLSTHILSLNSFLYKDRHLERAIRRNHEAFVRQKMRKDSFSFGSSTSSIEALGDTPDETDLQRAITNSSNLEERLLGSRFVFIAAGTNVGTIYVWKLPYVELLARVQASVDDKVEQKRRRDDIDGEDIVFDFNQSREKLRKLQSHQTLSAKWLFSGDNGTYLHSLLQVSDRPIIHVSMSIMSLESTRLIAADIPVEHRDDEDLVLCTSDNQGIVRIYAPECAIPPEWEENMKSFLQMKADGGTVVELKGLERHHLHEEYRVKLASDIDAPATNAHPLVRVGEQGFSSPVVCCCFPPAYAGAPVDEDSVEENVLDDAESISWAGKKGLAKAMVLGGTKRSAAMKELARWDPSKMIQRSSPLLVGLASGDARMYDTTDLHSLSKSRKQSYRSIYSNFTNVHGENARSATSALIREAQQRNNQRAASNDSNSSGERADTIVLQLGEISSKVPFLSKRGKKTDAEDAETVYSDDVKEIMSVNDSFLTRLSTGTRRKNKIKSPGTMKSSMRSLDGDVNQSGELTKRKSVTYADDVHHNQVEKIEIEGDDEPQPRALPPVPLFPIRDDGVQQSTSFTFSPNASVAPSQVAGKNYTSEEDVEATKPLRHKETNTIVVPSKTASHRHMRGNNKKHELHSTLPATAEEDSASNGNKNGEDDSGKDLDDILERPPLPTHLQNSLGTPSLMQTTAIENELLALTRKIENDEISVSTQKTTDSDRRYAAQIVNSALTTAQRRFQSDHFASDGNNIRLQSKIPKQVDQEWLQQRLHGGPTAEDLQPLMIPDPRVSLKFNHLNGAEASSCASVSTTGGASSIRGRKHNQQSRYDYNTTYGLHYRMNPDTLLPEFRHEVNVDQLFGKLDPVSSLAAGRHVRDEFITNTLMDIMFSSEPASII